MAETPAPRCNSVASLGESTKAYLLHPSQDAGQYRISLDSRDSFSTLDQEIVTPRSLLDLTPQPTAGNAFNSDFSTDDKDCTVINVRSTSSTSSDLELAPCFEPATPASPELFFNSVHYQQWKSEQALRQCASARYIEEPKKAADEYYIESLRAATIKQYGVRAYNHAMGLPPPRASREKPLETSRESIITDSPEPKHFQSAKPNVSGFNAISDGKPQNVYEVLCGLRKEYQEEEKQRRLKEEMEERQTKRTTSTLCADPEEIEEDKEVKVESLTSMVRMASLVTMYDARRASTASTNPYVYVQTRMRDLAPEENTTEPPPHSKAPPAWKDIMEDNPTWRRISMRPKAEKVLGLSPSSHWRQPTVYTALIEEEKRGYQQENTRRDSMVISKGTVWIPPASTFDQMPIVQMTDKAHANQSKKTDKRESSLSEKLRKKKMSTSSTVATIDLEKIKHNSTNSSPIKRKSGGILARAKTIKWGRISLGKKRGSENSAFSMDCEGDVTIYEGK
ncbi:hypothetical protein BZA77DRAFT_297418 [Pyronema omphalodes]|nr:hypothetical protein BZA77DRAFT_297418 [Pyronema omphalodes]